MTARTERFARRLVGGLTAAAAAWVMTTTSAFGAPAPDQSTQAQNFNSAWLGSGQTIAQLFTAGLTGALTSVDVYLSRQYASTTNLTVSIFGVDPGGHPTGNALASRLLTSAEVTALPLSRPVNPVTSARLNVAFTSPPRVVDGTTYAIVVASTDDYPAYHWLSSTTPDTSPSSWQCSNASWGAYEQLSFATYVDTAQAGGTEGTSFASACSDGLYVPPIDETASSESTRTNLLGPNGNASIVHHEDFTGVAGVGVTDPLDEIYDHQFPPGSAPISPSDVDCESPWQWEQILCDLEPTIDSAMTLTKHSQAVGATFANDADQEWYAYYVVDLGARHTLGTLQVYQMFDSGKVTHVSLEAHPQGEGVRPSISDPGWFTALPKSFVNAGTRVSSTRVADPTSFPLGSVNTRYVLLKLWNDGTHGDADWLEVGGLKLFADSAMSSPLRSDTPERRVFALSFDSANGALCSTASQSGDAGSWMPLPGEESCTPPTSKPGARLLGWATSPGFPVALARRQVDNGWGTYEMLGDDGQLIAVFIPVGGSTLVSAAGNLYPIWSE